MHTTANVMHVAYDVGGRRVRGGRGCGGSVVASTASDGLNEEELAGNGVKVDTLKTLLAKEDKEEEKKEEEEGKEQSEENANPPKLISLDQVLVKGEDITGKSMEEIKMARK